MSLREKINEIKDKRNEYFICVLEHPNKEFNLASAIRNVQALGVEKLYIVGGYKGMPKDFETFRTHVSINKMTVGASRWTFVKVFKTTAECIAHLKKNLYTIAVTSSHTKELKNISLYEGEFTQKRLAIWFGNESKGISADAVASANFCIHIPMAGIVESLNLGTSTGIVLSYIGYQRQKFVEKKKEEKQVRKNTVE